MKFPLYAKLTLCLLLNLALVALVLVLAPGRRETGWNLLLSPPVRDRLVSIAQSLSDDLAQADAEQYRNAIFERYQTRYGVLFTLERPDGGPPGPAYSTGHSPPRLLAGPDPGAPPPPPFEDRGPSPGGALAPGMAGPPPFERSPPPGFTAVHFDGPPPLERGQRASFITIRFDRALGGYVLLIPAVAGERPPRQHGVQVKVIAADVRSLIGFLGIADGARLLLLLIALSALLWTPLIVGMTRALIRLTETTERIAEGRLDVRLAVSRRDEIGTLAGAINRMAQRLESSGQRQRNFMADVAHEVTSPLARIRMGLGLLETRLGGKERQLLADIEEDAGQMSRLLNELLLFSRAGIEAGSAAPQAVNLAAVALDAIAQEAAQQRAAADIAADLAVSGHRALLTRAVANLVRNSLRYAPADSGTIELAAWRRGADICLAVRDRGPGVPEEVLAHLGEPFYRPESARSRDTGGSGLGLAIVRRCVESCGGSVAFANRAGGGLEATILLHGHPAGAS